MEHTSGFSLPNSGHNRDAEASKMGMWLFLFTELLLFGGLFIVYMVYRSLNPESFLLASFELDVTMGTFNTIVLLVSSMTIAMSITAIQTGNAKKSILLLYTTLGLAIVFLIVKYFEWSAKIHHGLFPGFEVYDNLPPGESLFFFLYFFMTGLHALHIIIGGIIISVVIHRTNKGLVNKEKYTLTENAGLYWHLVDLIWIYLFPLFYLIH
ncbi:MAG: cytochrome c oxidase subunit 3 family protein [Bacteroidales bacterium]|jgi:cytochrome c oxidase subunit 3|nr:cytochrome c oxidase subunit 3 family protein [Bacteroidales bacterium]HOI31517.1 cytochrome c oxidase subunit 3 family protein [Bacteroidales bacterium]